MSTPDRGVLLERDHPVLSIRGQCRLLGLARSGVYRRRRPTMTPIGDDAADDALSGNSSARGG